MSPLDILDSLDLTLRALNTRIPEVDPQRCVATRYQASSCRRCVAVCSGDAITPIPTLEVYPDKCLGCGACAVVCPTGALDFAQPRAALQVGLRTAGSETVGMSSAPPPTSTGAAVTVACTRGHLSAGRGTGIRVECLGSVGAADLLLAYSAGVRSIDLIDGGCAGCRSERAVSNLPETIAAAESVIAALADHPTDAQCSGTPVSAMMLIRRTSADRSFAAPRSAEDNRGGETAAGERSPGARSAGPVLSRRQLLLFFGLRSARVVKTSATKQGRSVSSLHARKEPPSTHKLLKRALAKLAPADTGATRGQGGDDVQAALPVTLIESLHLATITVSPACDACGLCVRYCPHGALETRDGRLVIDLESCTACGLCAEVCPPAAISLGPPYLTRPSGRRSDPSSATGR